MVGKLYPSGHTEVTEDCPDCNGLGYIEEESKPLTVDDLIKGEIYFYTFIGFCDHIVEYDGNYLAKYDIAFNHVNGHNPNFLKNTYPNSSLTDGTLKKGSLRLATPEEKQWLHVCIAEDKFIKKDYALRGYDMDGKTLKSEIDETFKEGTLIKGEFYNLPGYAIFEAGKKGYIGSGGRDWRAICDNNWAGPNDFIPATPLEKKWVITCRKQNKFIEQSELNKYDDEGNLIENEMTKCVITTTQEEWDFCLSKCDQSSRLSKCNDKFKQWSKPYPEGIAVCIENDSYCGINWFKKQWLSSYIFSRIF